MAREVNNVLELVALADDLQQENQELKKQLEEKENQQKEFLDWLNKKINMCDKDIKLIGKDCYTSKYGYEESLTKYKEIIGGKDE